MQELDECVSFVLISSEKHSPMSRQMLQILECSGSVIPVELRQMADEYTEEVEKGKPSKLCHSMKNIGICRYIISERLSHKSLLVLASLTVNGAMSLCQP